MARSARFLACLLGMMLLSSLALGADLGTVTLNSFEDQHQLESIVESAYWRAGNTLVIVVDNSQQTQLALAGLTFKPLAFDVNADDLSLVFTHHLPESERRAATAALGETFDLGDGMMAVRATASAAQADADHSHIRLIPLSGYSVPTRYFPPKISTALPEDFVEDSIASLVSQDSVYAWDRRLEAFQTRYITTDSIDAARDWMMQKFLDWGYADVSMQPFEYDGDIHYNVKAVKPGYAEEDKLIVVGAHYDATSTDPLMLAPGADDNASGTAVVLEMARVFADIPLRKTIIFMPFSAEEQGLIGSHYAAVDFREQGADLELMINHDMIGHNSDPDFDVNMQSGNFDGYRDLCAATAERLTSLVPILASNTGNSDHASFRGQGYNTYYGHEAEFNTTHYHQTHDSSTYLDYNYMTQIATVAIVSAAIVANGTYPIAADEIVDLGDGQSLRAGWSDCASDVDYWVYWGTSSGSLTDSMLAPTGECGVTLDGLTEGQEYFINIFGIAPNGYRSMYSEEGSGTPLTVPRTPSALVADSDTNLTITLDWAHAVEADFDHYNVYRRYGGIADYSLYQTTTDTTLTDINVVSQVAYSYQITAVDTDGNESIPAVTEPLYPVSFDGGLVLVDSWRQEYDFYPDEAEQRAWLDSVFMVDYTLVERDSLGEVVKRSDIGRFTTLIWIDEDITTKTLRSSDSTLRWFSEFDGNLIITGYNTAVSWNSFQEEVDPDHMLATDFLIDSLTYRGWGDWVGAYGQNGWPTVEVDSSRGPDGASYVPLLYPQAGVEVIYRFNTLAEDDWENQPCAVAWESPHGKRVLIPFPLHYLGIPDAQALVAKLFDYLGDSGQSFVNGDIDGSGTIDIADLQYLIEYLFLSYALNGSLAAADVVPPPVVDIGDLMYLVDYLFLGGPGPSPPQL